MENFTGLVEYDRLTVISKLESHIQKLEEQRRVKIEKYHQSVRDYKALLWPKRWLADNPEEEIGWYPDALSRFVSYEAEKICDLQKQIRAFKLSESPKIWINSDSWLIKWLE